MKKVNFIKIFCCTLVLGFIVILTGCEKSDTLHLEWLNQGEEVYAGKVDSIAVHGGNKRVNIEANVTVNNLEKLLVYWNNNNDSISVPVNEQTGLFDVTIENLLEQTYVFNIVSVDIFGNRSLPVESVGSIYGDFYQSTLVNRSSTSLSLSGEDFILEFDPAAEGVEFVEVVYVNIDDVTVTARVEPEEESLIFQNYKSGLKHRTVYKPDPIALDLFYTDYDDDDYSIMLSNSNWSIVDFSSQQSGGSGHAATNFIDGNIDTFWHTLTNFSTTNTVLYPQFITVDLGAAVSFSTVAIYNGDADWVPAKIEILVAESDVNNMTSLGEFNRDASPGALKVQQNHDVTLPGPVRYIRIVATEPGPNASMPDWGTEFVLFSEMELFF